MTKTLRNRLTLLGTTSLFAAALVAAPVRFSSVTPEFAVANAQQQGDGSGEVGDTTIRGGDANAAMDGGSGGGSGGTDPDATGPVGGGDVPE